MNNNQETPDFAGENINPVARAVFIFLGTTEILSGVIGNSLLLTVLFGAHSLLVRSFHNLFVANLALADLVILAYWMTFFVLDLLLGYHPVADQVHCRINGFLIATCYVVHTLSLLSISLNRYLHVCRSRLYHRLFSFRSTLLSCALLWVMGVTIALPPLLGVGSYRYSAASHFCSFYRDDPNQYAKVLVILFSVLPMATVGYLNFAIFRYWRRFHFRYRVTERETCRTRENTSDVQSGNPVRFESRKEEGDLRNENIPLEVLTANAQESYVSQGNAFSAQAGYLAEPKPSSGPTQVLRYTSHSQSNSADSMSATSSVQENNVSQDNALSAPAGFLTESKPSSEPTQDLKHTSQHQSKSTGGATSAAPCAQDDSEEMSLSTATEAFATQNSSPESAVYLGCARHARPKPPTRRRRVQCTNARLRSPRHRTDKKRNKEEAFVRSLFVVFLLMLCSFFPFGTVIIVSSYVTVPSEVSIAANLVLFFNSAVNWIVYGAMNPSFKRRYVRNLRCLLGACRQRRRGGEIRRRCCRQ